VTDDLYAATITGAIISSTVLKQEALVTDSSCNGMDDSEIELDVCGASDCPWFNMTVAAQRPTDHTVI